MPARINVEQVPSDQLKQLGVRMPRHAQFSKDEMRSWSLKALACLAGLSRSQRDRVLRHALKVNAI
jgi:hypothetical protein